MERTATLPHLVQNDGSSGGFPNSCRYLCFPAHRPSNRIKPHLQGVRAFSKSSYVNEDGPMVSRRGGGSHMLSPHSALWQMP